MSICVSDMRFVQNFTPFQAKNFTSLISPNISTVLTIKTQKMRENGEIYTAGKNFALPLAVTAWTNLTSGACMFMGFGCVLGYFGVFRDCMVQQMLFIGNA